jgi:hypothetical protein
VSCLGERGLSLYKLLKKSHSFLWTGEAQKALDDLKALICKPPVLSSLEPGKTLLLYIVANKQVISATLVVEREGPGHVYKIQRLIYYNSKFLSNCETHYSLVLKLLYTILITECKLLHYFEMQPIRVVILFELEEIIKNRLVARRITKWALELMVIDME